MVLVAGPKLMTAVSSGLRPGQGAARVMLLCGADVVESFAAPGAWREEHLRRILGPDHGVVCIARRVSPHSSALQPTSGVPGPSSPNLFLSGPDLDLPCGVGQVGYGGEPQKTRICKRRTIAEIISATSLQPR